MSPSKGEASKSSAVRPRAESAALKASSVGAKTVTLAEVSSKAFSKPAALMAATRVERSGRRTSPPWSMASMSPVVTSGLMQSGLPWLKLEAPSVSVALSTASSRRLLPAREGIAEASTKAARSAVAMRFFLAIIIGREG